MLQFCSFIKTYSDQPVLDIPSLELKDNVYWVKGGNGAGKTTLLKCIAGIIPFSGTISYNGLNVKKHRVSYRKAISYAEAEPVFPGYCTGAEVLAFVADARGGTLEQCNELLATFNATHFAGNKIATYSSGMLKKISLCCAFAGAPSFIMLDEPLITLDVETVTALINLITKSIAGGCRFLITSHQSFSIPDTAIISLEIKNHTLITL